MPNAQASTSVNPIVISWLAKELEGEIPDIDIQGTEKRLLDFACIDLETYLEAKIETLSPKDIEKLAKAQDHKQELKAFLKVWTNQWLEKWRERVTLCQKMPQFSLAHVKAKKKAKKIFEHMKQAQEMKDMAVQKLINNGEVCMAELIAENLIIEEMATRLKFEDKDTNNKKTVFDPWDIMKEVMPRVTQIAERKTPLIHLKLMMDAQPPK